jgi:CheY-like chemotaxis protein
MAQLKGARLLLVEDNEINQQVAREMLTHAGFEVSTANDGQQALAAIAQSTTPFDLVLMDMQMPVMDGLQATRAIRLQQEHAQLPIVAMTANAMAQDRQRCLDAGMNDFVAKPIDPDLLWAALLRWIPPRQAYIPPPATQHKPALQPVALEPVLPQAIDGLDTALGLRRCMGKVDFYRQMLSQFTQQQSDTPALVQQAMDQQQWSEARRLAHSLKGVAGNLGATHIQALAETLEHSLIDNPGPEPAQRAQDQLNALQPALQRLLLALSAALQETPTAAPPPALASIANGPLLRSTCTELKTLLESGDLAAQDWIQQHQDQLSAALGAQKTPLINAIANFDFDQALLVLQKCCDQAPPA